MEEPTRGRRGRRSADLTLMKALAGGASHAEAAREANVSLRTVTRRLADPSFLVQLDGLHARTLDGIAADLSAGTATAVATLVELLGVDQPPTVRVAAARALVSATLQYSQAAATLQENVEPAESNDLEDVRQRAFAAIDELGKKRTRHFEASQRAGHAPPDPPSCIDHHEAGDCDDCQGWQETAHATVIEHCIDAGGRLTETGVQLREHAWPLRAATIQLLNAAYQRRRADRSVA